MNERKDRMPVIRPRTPRERAFSRRALVGGGAALAAAGAAGIGVRRAGGPARGEAAPAAPVVTAPEVAAPMAQEPTVAPMAPAAPRRTPVADALRTGYALVTSPRLPLAGIGPGDPERILNGTVTDWRSVGSPLSAPIERLALSGAERGGVEIYPDYDALAAALRERRGAVALVPLDQIDFRVQTLAVGGIDPLTSGEGIEAAMRMGTVGDIVPGRNVHRKMADYGDFTRPFQRISPLLSSFDLTIANLEGNLSDTIPQPENPNTFSFVSNTAMLDGFRLAGIDAVTVANNHTVWNAPEESWGLQAFLDTLAALETAGMPYFGGGYDLQQARAPWFTELGGVNLAWLGIDGVTANYEVEPGKENGVVDFDAGATADRAGTNPYLSEYFLADISAAAAQAQVVIPYFHMGAEYIAVPPEWVTAGARSAIDAGATMVITNHPHVIQGMEIYNGRPIVYSVGNFIIDQMWAVEVRSGYVLETLLRGDRIVGLRVHGTEIEDFHQPRRMTAGEQANLLDRFWASTDRLIARG
jgi:poly-gamma-glutamate synthesis protein (capsule biosynthesis protein)